MGSVFKFKQFEINQNGCAMKINTDGVILGATAVKLNARRILDVGTGTGVIALMLAQRFPDAFIDAIEIDESAALAAAANFKASVFTDRIVAYHGDVISYKSNSGYDLIVSNPPYFVNDLKNPENRKRIARHADESFFESLLLKAAELLSTDGCLWLILPVKQADDVIAIAAKFDLFLCKQINVCSDAEKPIIRRIVCLCRSVEKSDYEAFYIYETKGGHTAEYKLLLKDFFLAF